ncbi:TPA: ead/Ea22-like family protein [Citrobacter freundii]
MTALNKQALREAAVKATPGEWKRMMRNSDELMTTFHGVAIGNVFVELTTGKRDIFDAEFIATASPATVLALLDELEAAEKQTSALFKENARLKSGIAGLVHLGIRHGDIEVMSIAGDAQLSTPCTDSIIEKIAAGIGVKGD